MVLVGFHYIYVSLRTLTVNVRVEIQIAQSKIQTTRLGTTRRGVITTSLIIILLHNLKTSEVGLCAIGIVTHYAVAVKYWLHLQIECKRTNATLGSLQRSRSLGRCHHTLGHRQRVLILVTAHAREHLTGHTRNPATHPLNGATLLVQRLERHGGIGRNLEHSRAIGFNIHLTQITLYIPSALDTLRDMV